MNGKMSVAPSSWFRLRPQRALRLVGVLAMATLLPSACKPKSKSLNESSELANVSINELSAGNYERYKLQLTSLDPTIKADVSREFTRGSGLIQVQVLPGSYRFVLEYFRGNEIIYSSKLCPDRIRNDEKALVKGNNNILIRVCGVDAEPINDTGSQGGVIPASQATFSVQNGQLIDPLGKPFVMRGINNPHAYYREQSYAALTTIKDMGFNTVRIVWCADTLIRANRCDPKDIHPIGELDRVLARMRTLKLTAVLNLQNATGSDSKADLQAMADYLLKPEVKTVLLRHKEILLINIANEWYGTSDKSRAYIEAYQSVIPQLRRGGLPHSLIVDARGWGQDFSSIAEHANDFKVLDANVVLSSHMYENYGSAEQVRAAFRTVRSAKIPYIVGEFACSHGPSKAVACETILEEAASGVQKYGTIVWSMTGNSRELSDLDFVDPTDWKTLTPFGQRILRNPLVFALN